MEKNIRYCYKNRTRCSNDCFKKAEATEELTRNKITQRIVKLKPVPDANLINVEVIVISPEERQGILNELRQVL